MTKNHGKSKRFYSLFSLRCGSKTDEQNGEDKNGRLLRNQRTRRNGTNRRKQQQRNQTRAKVMWIQTADSAKTLKRKYCTHLTRTYCI